MSLFIVLVIVVIAFVAGGIKALKSKRGVGTRREIRYVRIECMTPTELQFFQCLVEALPEAAIAPQVAMSALVDAPANLNVGMSPFAARGKISQKRLDFVIFDKASGEAVCVVELDDWTHDNRVQKRKDSERNTILKGAGYEIRRFDARKMPTTVQLRKAFMG
jgi:hypothetical protein